jgi:1,4-dihydroxy-2-naphthoyl-CoA hydrolase
MSDAPPKEPLPNVAGNGWNRALGLVIDEVTDDRVLAHLDAGPQHQQPYGVLHGGAWCSIVEEAASIGAGMRSLRRDGRGVLGVSNHTDFLRSHAEGRLDVVAEPLHAGRSAQLWEVRVSRASDGQLVARGQVRFHVLEELPGDRQKRLGTESDV